MAGITEKKGFAHLFFKFIINLIGGHLDNATLYCVAISCTHRAKCTGGVGLWDELGVRLGSQSVLNFGENPLDRVKDKSKIQLKIDFESLFSKAAEVISCSVRFFCLFFDLVFLVHFHRFRSILMRLAS